MSGTAVSANSDTDTRLQHLEREVAELRRELEASRHVDSVSIVCFSGDWDRLFAAFTIATGALALGQEVHLFFTFWGATAVRKSGGSSANKSLIQKLFGRLLPQSIAGAPLSKLNFGGMSKVMLGKLMKQKGVDDLPTLMQQARELGAQFHYCDTSLQLFGWGNDELVDGDESDWCGVSSFLAEALKGRIVMFI